LHGDCTNMSDALRACKKKDVVMNLAARVGGIEYNRLHQATMLRDNLNIEITMIEAARVSHVERFLVISSACVYPRGCSVPTPETEGFVSEPEPTNGGYGWAKRMAELLGKYYADEYGMQIAIVRPYNCYGPRDHFDPKTSHVIPALIKRVFDGENPVIVWGSGTQTRAFLYVEDLADGMITAIEKYPVPDPVNLGTDEEVSISDLVNRIIEISGIKTKITFDTTKPDGSPRRNSDNKKAQEKIGFKARILLHEGLEKTISWYKNEFKK
ncbi:MAG: NAD-dependent epimerase/dehydratase family protein, partial [Candidatus Woesebacteria bacterium]|nr:NAD-dependent epimerase/dehydratase family protein [Candidatus Woesebacteria bacterium]